MLSGATVLGIGLQNSYQKKSLAAAPYNTREYM